jgi:hypothetical protein
MTHDDMDKLDIQALGHYILWDDAGFNALTEGPRHRRALLSRLFDKKSSGLLREQLISNFLGLSHNSKMHSTTDGVTTYDAVHPITGDCYEIKAEEHTTNNPGRKTQSGQLAGAGVFSNIQDEAGILKFKNDNPMIAHGMFGDGRLLALVTFRLSDTTAIERITKYCLGDTKTEPRYMFSNWEHANFNLMYVAPQWPVTINKRYRKIFHKKLSMSLSPELAQLRSDLQNLPQVSVPKKRSRVSTKSRTRLQIPIPCMVDLGQQQTLDFAEIQSTYPYVIS